jgi:hypothetical protein
MSPSLQTDSALAHGASPTLDRVISIGMRLVGLAPSGPTEPAIARTSR